MNEIDRIAGHIPPAIIVPASTAFVDNFRYRISSDHNSKLLLYSANSIYSIYFLAVE